MPWTNICLENRIRIMSPRDKLHEILSQEICEHDTYPGDKPQRIDPAADSPITRLRRNGKTISSLLLGHLVSEVRKFIDVDFDLSPSLNSGILDTITPIENPSLLGRLPDSSGSDNATKRISKIQVSSSLSVGFNTLSMDHEGGTRHVEASEPALGSNDPTSNSIDVNSTSLSALQHLPPCPTGWLEPVRLLFDPSWIWPTDEEDIREYPIVQYCNLAQLQTIGPVYSSGSKWSCTN